MQNSCNVTSGSTVDQNIVAEFTIRGKKKKITGDTLLVATGIRPNTDSLDVEKTGVKLTERGFVKVNSYMETNVKGIWAIGDILMSIPSGVGTL